MKRWYADTYTVERRFGLGAILLATLYCAAMLSFFRWLDFGFPIDFLFFSGLLISVAVAQVWWPESNPRRVSGRVGLIYALFFFISIEGVGFLIGARIGIVALVIVCVLCYLFGSLLGYCAGAVAASLFLVNDLLHQWGMPPDEDAQEVDVSPFDDEE